MKITKTLILAVLSLLFCSVAFAGPYDDQPGSMLFVAPATTPGYPLVQTGPGTAQGTGGSMQFSGVVNALDFPVTVFVPPGLTPTAASAPAMLSALTTAAANAAVPLPANPTPGQMWFTLNGDPTRSTTVWPSANTATTPAAINSIAAGSPATLTHGEGLLCYAETGLQWRCAFLAAA